ncbi:hypothetical protein [Kosmotoga olearia]|uniref:hypothetical protein n=1 Tax=Kosmotoga olearia TaxID=651457 RepID=UPI0001849019|nr:hypothetical protein [Kosmotoga olearia]
MHKNEIVERLESFQQRLLQLLPQKFRPVFDSITLDARAYLITGPRGVGKPHFCYPV